MRPTSDKQIWDLHSVDQVLRARNDISIGIDTQWLQYASIDVSRNIPTPNINNKTEINNLLTYKFDATYLGGVLSPKQDALNFINPNDGDPHYKRHYWRKQHICSIANNCVRQEFKLTSICIIIEYLIRIKS